IERSASRHERGVGVQVLLLQTFRLASGRSAPSFLPQVEARPEHFERPPVVLAPGYRSPHDCRKGVSRHPQPFGPGSVLTGSVHDGSRRRPENTAWINFHSSAFGAATTLVCPRPSVPAMPSGLWTAHNARIGVSGPRQDLSCLKRYELVGIAKRHVSSPQPANPPVCRRLQPRRGRSSE